MKVTDNNNTIATATDTSKKKAEQMASKLALYKFKQLSDYQMNDEDFELLNQLTTFIFLYYYI